MKCRMRCSLAFVAGMSFWRFIWINVSLVFSETLNKRSQTYYADGRDCSGEVKTLGGAIVYSHVGAFNRAFYRDGVDCRMTFKAERSGWRLMLRFIQLDIPDRTGRDICNDAVYIYDGATIFSRAVKQAGGIGGLCGSISPAPFYSSGSYLTVHFRSNGNGPSGNGFLFVVTAFNENFDKFRSCGDRFHCIINNKCIDRGLVCDSVDNCGDYSDERDADGLICRKAGESLLSKFLSLGIAASLAISVGSVVLVVVCLSCLVCCCCQRLGKPVPDSTAKTPTTASGVTSMAVVAHNGSSMTTTTAPTTGKMGQQMMTYQHNYMDMNAAMSYPLQSVPSVVSSYGHFIQRNSHCGSSACASRSPPPFRHPCTPPSSRSGRSHSSDNNIKYTFERYQSDQPVHV